MDRIELKGVSADTNVMINHQQWRYVHLFELAERFVHQHPEAEFDQWLAKRGGTLEEGTKRSVEELLEFIGIKNLVAEFEKFLAFEAAMAEHAGADDGNW